MANQHVKSKKITLIFVFSLFLSIINTSLSQGMQFDIDDEENNSSITLSPVNIKDDEKDNSTSVLLSSDEKTTLVDKTNPISNSYVLAFREDIEESSARCLGAKYAVSLLAGIGPIIPQIAIALKIGEYFKSPWLGYTLIGTTILSIEGITAWLVWELIDDTQKLIKKSKQSQPNQVNRRSCGKYIKGIGIGGLSLILGALSSAPDVYKTYKYNSIKEFAIISFIYDTIPRTIGFYKFFSTIDTTVSKICEKESIVKNKGVQVVDFTEAYFINQCKEKGIKDVSNTLKNYDTPSEIYSHLSSNFQQVASEETLPNYYGKGIPRKIVKLLALAFPLGSAGFNMVLAYKGWNLFIDNQVALGLLSVFSVLPTFALSSHVVMEAAGNLFDKIYLCRSKVPFSSYFETFHPKTRKAFIGFSVLLGAANSLTGFFLIADNLQGTILSPAKYLFAALAVTTDLTFGSYTVYSTLINYGEAIKKKCNKGASYMLGCLKKLRDVKDSIVNSTVEFVKGFLSDAKDK